MINVGIVGASGYTGAELTRILSNHPQVKLTVATSRKYAGTPLAEVFPNLRQCTDVVCENLPTEALAEQADFFFTAVPHKTAMDIVPSLLEAGKKVVDLSADFRLRDVAVYEQWYDTHTCGHLLSEAVYGLPELYRDKIRDARLVANPGCYPTSIILGLAPLLRNNCIKPETLIADSKSGATGAGRAASVGTLFCEVNDGFRAYKTGGTHRHTPEIEQEISLLAGNDCTITFTPHLLPVSRGILSTIYATMNGDCTPEELRTLYTDMYQNEQFVRVLAEGALPATQYVRGSNYCDIGVQVDPRTGRIIVLSAIDNVVKGASGQAVQNMNLMLGFEESTGLTQVPLFP
ncbi:N-acetyl-gamma-glutamyl-phosphate reductase [Desulfogranum japonicum]|uniref:N-acetyl-gamma-glutamyl-phosphate reductase n=1 Tax=Desulfogranum japonicum TaxID=231447 RepID=UPI0004068AE1|nr:N-acetyl-gamma-glutamyl-phosphate reductase [Desulfogranum japonicum]